MKKKIAGKPPPKEKVTLPIPLTCGGPFITKDNRCSHGLDNGSCDMPEQFICPFYLRAEAGSPENFGEVPRALVEKFKSTKPVNLVGKKNGTAKKVRGVQ